MKLLLAIVALIVAILVLPMVLPPPADPGGKKVEGLPWQIEALSDGTSRVFGLTLGTSTVAEARGRFDKDAEPSIVAAPGEAGSLETFFDQATLGAVTGKLVVTADLSETRITEMRARSPKFDYMNSSTKKHLLAEADYNEALASRIRAIALIPSINLDEAMILQRFGQPAERVRTSEHAEHFLYPERGLDILLDSEGKELLQYVAPRDFERLREPLKSQGTKP
jgi:hypothetical protein